MARPRDTSNRFGEVDESDADHIEEARIGVVTAERPSGEKVQLVCNFLSKLQPDLWVERWTNDSSTPVALGAETFGNNSLARIFEAAISEVTGQGQADLIANRRAKIVHSIILDAQRDAFGDSRDPKQEIERARGTSGARLLVPRGPEGNNDQPIDQQ